MISHLPSAIAALAAGFAVCSLGYCGLCLYGGIVFHRQQREAGKDVLPTRPVLPFSILKPLKGADPEIYENLRSHCRQEYPEFEIIFGVSDPGDAAVEVVKRLQAEFPRRVIRLVVCDQVLGPNRKVSNLAQMLPAARYETILVSDSDIRVPPGYLHQIAGPVRDPNIGLVTCLYRGVPAPTLWSRLESLGISTDFAAGVLAARQLEGGVRFGLGSTLAFRRSSLEAAGGFEALTGYLADDYQIGKRIADRGLRVELSAVVVETFLAPYSWHAFFQHQVRCGRAVRDSRPSGYLGLILTFGFPWVVVALLAGGGRFWAWLVLSAGL